MQQMYQDAMAVIRKRGKPDLFLTFTANPTWPEITRNLLPNQQANDRPDLIARVFHLKLKKLLHMLKTDKIFGVINSMIHVIEFQKRGLPHAHLLIILDEQSKIRDQATIDKLICAELPDPVTQKELFDIVSTTMIHGPCGALNPKSPCMRNGKCKLKEGQTLPRPYRDETDASVNGFPMYRRRDNGVFFMKMVNKQNIKVIVYIRPIHINNLKRLHIFYKYYHFFKNKNRSQISGLYPIMHFCR